MDRIAEGVSGVVDLVSFAAEYRGIEDITVPPAGCLYVGNALKGAGFKVNVHHIFSSQIEQAFNAIRGNNPLFVGFSVITGSPVVHSAVLSRLIKSKLPRVPIVWGGVHPSLMPEACLKEESVDFVIRGEGEVTVTEFARSLQQGGGFQEVSGLCWKDSEGTPHLNAERPFIKDLDRFCQDWDLVDPARYVRRGLDGTEYISFITSRGCPYNCGFCYNLSFNRRLWRAHSVDFVVDAVQKLHEMTGINCVTFNDDNFLVNESRAFQILERLQRIGVRVSWLEIRLDRINERILGKLKKYGVRTLFVGWESGSNRTLKEIDKGFDTSLIVESFRLIAKYSFEVDASAIVGFPFENQMDWKETIDMALRIDEINPGRNKFNIGVYLPYPGTPIVQQAIQREFRFPEDNMEWDAFDILKGKMKLPWISTAQVHRFALTDRYAKMLYTSGHRKSHFAFLGKVLAVIARIRLKYHILCFPIEAFLYGQLTKVYLRKRIRAASGYN